MKAVNLNGSISSLNETDSIPSGASILTSPVTISKIGSANLGKKAEIVNVRNNKIVVQQLDGDKLFGTYEFNQLSNNN